MALVKNKKILLNSQFKHYDDPFYAPNAVYGAIRKNCMPAEEKDVQIAKGQCQFFSFENVLNRLLQNDKYIDLYLQKIRHAGIPADRAKNAFSTSVSSVGSSYFSDRYRDHIAVHHSEFGDYATPAEVYVNYCRSDLKNFDDDAARRNFLSSSESALPQSRTKSYSQDVLLSCEFDDSPWVNAPTNYVNVKVCNFKTDNKFSYSASKSVVSPVINQVPHTDQSKYIYKEWLSGLKELYIYIPSTFTFYNDNVDLSGNGPHSNATYIQVVINKRHFNFSNIYQMQIQGQSLPLQIHKQKSQYFEDCIQPSIVRTPCFSGNDANNTDCVYDEITNMITLYFCCYGTDAQAIRIFGE